MFYNAVIQSMIKHVITGGPCAGKTSVINELRKRNLEVIEEFARRVIAERKHLPATAEEFAARERMIFYRQLFEEDALDRKNLSRCDLFLDRGLLDTIAYSIHYLGKSFDDFNSHVHGRYASVFILERLPFVDDGLRIESGEEEAQKLHDRLMECYVSHGYTPIIVPVMPVKERVEFILKNIKKINGG